MNLMTFDLAVLPNTIEISESVIFTTLIAPVLLPWALPNNIASEQQA